MIQLNYKIRVATNAERMKRRKEKDMTTREYFQAVLDAHISDEMDAASTQLIQKLDGESLDLPVAFDWEDFGHFQSYGMNLTELNRLYDAFADELSKSGYSCMLYSSKVYLEKVWKDTDIRPVWLAHYTDKTDYEGPYMMWQTSCTGKINGIDTDVDMDILYHY